MVRPLMTDTVFLAQKAQPADAGSASGNTRWNGPPSAAGGTSSRGLVSQRCRQISPLNCCCTTCARCQPVVTPADRSMTLSTVYPFACTVFKNSS